MICPDLSIVFGTYNRLAVLRKCISSVRAAVDKLNYEIVIVDGGSTDGTLEFLRDSDRVHLVEHGELLGSVAAYNDGFAACQGDMVAYINDDLILQPNTLAAACKILKQNHQVGIVSLRYVNERGTCVPDPAVTIGEARIPFASFGVLWRLLGERAGWYNGFYHYYGDCHLSVRIQQMGYELVTLQGYLAEHLNMDNAIRGKHIWDVPQARDRAREDGAKWAEMWSNTDG